MSKSINTFHEIEISQEKIDNDLLSKNVYKDQTIITSEEDIALRVMSEIQKQFVYEGLR